MAGRDFAASPQLQQRQGQRATVQCSAVGKNRVRLGAVCHAGRAGRGGKGREDKKRM